MEKVTECVYKVIDSLQDSLYALNTKIHSNPELSNQEFQAHNHCCDYLRQQGFDVTPSAYDIPTAFVASFGTVSKPTIAFLCEYDALPSIGHACGHNLIATLGIAAGIACKESMKLTLPFRVLVIGTPAEETTGGKIALLEAGAFKDVDVALMAHPGPENILYGCWLALQSFKADFYGKASHASARPWEGINALDAAVSSYNAISSLRQQILPSDRIHGIITKGGDAPNIIPSHTTLEYYIRSKTLSELKQLDKKVQSCFQGASLSTGCRLSLQYERPVAHVKSNHILGSIFKAQMSLLGVEYTSETDDLPRGSTDMGNITNSLPGIHPLFSIAKNPIDFSYHTLEFSQLASTLDAHQAALSCAKGLALTGILASRPETLAKIQDEFYSNT